MYAEHNKEFPPHLFEVEGYSWECVSSQVFAMHIVVGVDHVCAWAYTNKPSVFNIVRYEAESYSDLDREQWVTPLEALCIMQEAAKEAACSTPKNTKRRT